MRAWISATPFGVPGEVDLPHELLDLREARPRAVERAHADRLVGQRGRPAPRRDPRLRVATVP